MDEEQRTVAYGFCHCGCGRKTKVAYRNIKRSGHVKGEPVAYLPGHNARYTGPEWATEWRGYSTPCWIWQLDVRPNGYGVRRVDGINVSAHRRAWETAHGPVPEGMQVHHRCGVRACVNPEHLAVLAVAEHVREHAILTVEDVRRIKASLREFDGYGACPRLAKEYGVAVKTISDIKLGKTWADVA